MLNSIVSWALNMRVLIVAAALGLLVVGINATKNAPLDVFPEFAPPLVEVQTEAPGLSTEEVDSLVTVPLENSLNGLPFLKTIRSKSVLGLSSVVMIFHSGTDILKARQLVQERLNLAQSRLPAVVKPSVLMAPHSSLSRVLKVGLTSGTLDQMQLSELAVWTMRPRLMSVPGVANVAIWGQRDRQFQVLVDPQRLRAAGVTLDAITKAAGDASVISAGGFIDTPNLRLPVNQLSLITTPDDLARTVIEYRNGKYGTAFDVDYVVATVAYARDKSQQASFQLPPAAPGHELFVVGVIIGLRCHVGGLHAILKTSAAIPKE
jgi:Cu/Ag efflux pump CusA